MEKVHSFPKMQDLENLRKSCEVLNENLLHTDFIETWNLKHF